MANVKSSNFTYMTFGKTFSRSNGQPLDSTSIWFSAYVNDDWDVVDPDTVAEGTSCLYKTGLERAQHYATYRGDAYVGQEIVAVDFLYDKYADPDRKIPSDDATITGTTATVYVIENESGVLKQVGTEYDDTELRNFIGSIPETSEASNIIEYINEKTEGIATDTALEELQETVRGHGTKLNTISEGANKVEKSTTNGSIKIDGQEVTVYTHPEKHSIADITDLQNTLDDMTDTLASKQDVIPANTYDAYGSAAQALADAKKYADDNDANTEYGIEYDSTNKKIKLTSNISKTEIDVTAFIKDGMISSVELVNKDGSNNDGQFLKITWNTDAGKDIVYLDVTELVDVYTGADGIKVENNVIKHTNTITDKTSYVTATKTLTHGGTFDVVEEKYDKQGHITGAQTTTYTLPELPESIGTAVQTVTSDCTADPSQATSGLKVTRTENSVNVEIDDAVTFVFDCGGATEQ